jgi:hypothetical protein
VEFISIKMDVCVCVCICMFEHNSGMPGVISTKLGTQFPKGIWMIHVVEEIRLLLLLGNHMVMTSRLATVGQTYPRKHIVSAKM